MRRAHVFVLLAVTAALIGSGCRSSPPSVGPGGKIGTMVLVRGIEHKAEEEIFTNCDAVIPKPGRYRRTCSVPWAQWNQGLSGSAGEAGLGRRRVREQCRHELLLALPRMSERTKSHARRRPCAAAEALRC